MPSRPVTVSVVEGTAGLVLHGRHRCRRGPFAREQQQQQSSADRAVTATGWTGVSCSPAYVDAGVYSSHVRRQKHRWHCQRHEHHVQGDAAALRGGELPRRSGADARRDVPGAVSAASTSCSAMRTAWKSVSPAFCAPRPARRTAFTLRRRRTRKRFASRRPSAMRRSTTSTTTAAFSAGTAWRPARPTPLRTGMGFELATLNATNLVMRKEDLLVETNTLPLAPGSQAEAERAVVRYVVVRKARCPTASRLLRCVADGARSR